MKRFVLVLLAACSSSTTSPAPAPKPAPASNATIRPAGHGRVVTKTFHSDALGVDKDVVVYLPGGYDDAAPTKWPVFYYLHGLGGDETNWVKAGKLDEAADGLGLGAIVVMPDGDNGFYTDSATPVDYDACMKDGTGLFIPDVPKAHACVRTPAYETYIVHDLVAWTDKTFHTIADRSGRAIAGLSMGGFGALQLAIRHQDVFSAAASHSGVDALMYVGPHPYEKGKIELQKDPSQWGRAVGPIGDWVRGVFGKDLANWNAHDPAQLVDKIKPGLALYLDCGTEDDFLLHDGAAYLHDLLTDKHIAHEYFRGPGRHNFAFWTERLPKSLAFLATHVAPAK